MPGNGAPAALDRHPRDVLQDHGIRPRKALGQNFLVAAAHLDRIVQAAGMSPEDVVLEIGTGLGTLTARIAARAARVVSVEIDRRLLRIAADRLAGAANVSLLCCDFLAGKHRIDPTVTDAMRHALGARGRQAAVVSNLPYSISSPAIVNLLEWEVPVAWMCLTVQKEVADRLAARPGQSEYGPLTAFVSYWATVERLFNLPRRAFWPVPEVSSTVVRIVRKPERRLTGSYATFAAVVRKLFESRRKTLGHILRAGWGVELASGTMAAMKLDARTRAEDLSAAELEALAAALGPPRSG